MQGTIREWTEEKLEGGSSQILETSDLRAVNIFYSFYFFKADKTDDGTFEDYVDNFNKDSLKVSKLHKHLENYVQSLRAMNTAGTSLFNAFKEVG